MWGGHSCPPALDFDLDSGVQQTLKSKPDGQECPSPHIFTSKLLLFTQLFHLAAQTAEAAD
jgi:hypothetical protein